MIYFDFKKFITAAGVSFQQSSFDPEVNIRHFITPNV